MKTIFFDLILENYIMLIMIFTFYPISIKYFNSIHFNKDRFGVQDTHTKSTPRLGGLLLFLCLAFFAYVDDIHRNLIISFIPIATIALKEDITGGMSPQIRLLAMTLSAGLFLLFYDLPVPKIDIPFIGHFLSTPLLGSIFMMFCIMVITNGMNLVDGVNGLAAISTSIIIIALISILNLNIDDYVSISFLSITLIFIVIFLVFNYPSGLIFLGDCGAYLLGFIISCFSILVSYSNPELSSWVILLVLFYPGFEVMFSFIRKKVSGFNPFEPDRLHMHIIVFRILRNNKITKKHANNLSIFPIIPIILAGPLFAALDPYASTSNIVCKLFICVAIYLSIYFLILSLSRKVIH